MTEIEKKKYKAELLRVQAARAEMEYIIAQRMDEITRIEDNITKQTEAETRLLEKMKEE
jgi:hypothetical protein